MFWESPVARRAHDRSSISSDNSPASKASCSVACSLSPQAGSREREEKLRQLKEIHYSHAPRGICQRLWAATTEWNLHIHEQHASISSTGNYLVYLPLTGASQSDVSRSLEAEHKSAQVQTPPEKSLPEIVIPQWEKHKVWWTNGPAV